MPRRYITRIGAIQNGWYVSPTGAASGDGSYSNPWDIVTALAHPEDVQPGDTIWVREGTYVGCFSSEITGDANAPIIVRTYPGERATLDCNSSTTLAIGVNSSTTTIVLADALSLPARVGTSLLLGETENVYVSNVNANTLTVARGQFGSIASAHDAGAVVRPALTYALLIKGGHAWFWGLEITSSSVERVNAIEGSNPYNRPNGGVSVLAGAHGIRVINCIIHDGCNNGISCFSGMDDFVGYGNIIYHVGWDSSDRLHGHAIYTQNDSATLKKYYDNIPWSSFINTAVNQYGSSSATLENFLWEGNVFSGVDNLFAGQAPTKNLTLRSNYFFGNIPRFHYTSTTSAGLTLEDNYFGGGFQLYYFTDITGSNNTIFNRNYSVPLDIIFNTSDFASELSAWDFDNNQYYQSLSWPVWPSNWSVKLRPNEQLINKAAWQAYGVDANSVWTTVDNVSNVLQVPGLIVLRVNQYDPSRSHLVIYNWLNGSSVTVTNDILGALLNSGDSYRLRNAQNYYDDVVTGTYDGTSIAVDMVNRTIVYPVGWEDAEWLSGPPVVESTFPTFGVFVLEKL